MLWITAEENYFYNRDEGIKRVITTIKSEELYRKLDTGELVSRIKHIEYNPSPDRINQIMSLNIIDEINETGHKDNKINDLHEIVVVSQKKPSDMGFSDMGFFTELEIHSKMFPFTEEQISIGFDKKDILQKKLGLMVIPPQKTLMDIAGADFLREDVLRMLRLEEMGMMNIAGLFLFGVAGAGKSYFAECFAGETGRNFVVLDLPYFMTLPSPTKGIDNIFNFLLSQKNEKYLLFIDEIEKMFDFDGGNLIATQVFGKLLTRLNDVYADPNSNLTFVATANNITKIMSNSPEFLRKGRFNRLYFLNYPSNENAIKIFELYKGFNKKTVWNTIGEEFQKHKDGKITEYKKYFDNIGDDEEKALEKLKQIFFYDFNIESVCLYIEEKFSSSKQTVGGHFIYVPPEIREVAKELQNEYSLFLLEETDKTDVLFDSVNIEVPVPLEQFVTDIVRTIVPLQLSASEGIGKQIAQSKSFSKGNYDVKIFMEVS